MKEFEDPKKLEKLEKEDPKKFEKLKEFINSKDYKDFKKVQGRNNRLSNFYKSLAGITTVVLIQPTKDLLGCYLNTTGSLHNKEIPPERRNYQAGLDLTNGLLMVVFQLLLGLGVTATGAQKYLIETFIDKDAYYEEKVRKPIDKKLWSKVKNFVKQEYEEERTPNGKLFNKYKEKFDKEIKLEKESISEEINLPAKECSKIIANLHEEKEKAITFANEFKKEVDKAKKALNLEPGKALPKEKITEIREKLFEDLNKGTRTAVEKMDFTTENKDYSKSFLKALRDNKAALTTEEKKEISDKVLDSLKKEKEGIGKNSFVNVIKKAFKDNKAALTIEKRKEISENLLDYLKKEGIDPNSYAAELHKAFNNAKAAKMAEMALTTEERSGIRKKVLQKGITPSSFADAFESTLKDVKAALTTEERKGIREKVLNSLKNKRIEKNSFAEAFENAFKNVKSEKMIKMALTPKEEKEISEKVLNSLKKEIKKGIEKNNFVDELEKVLKDTKAVWTPEEGIEIRDKILNSLQKEGIEKIDKNSFANAIKKALEEVKNYKAVLNLKETEEIKANLFKSFKNLEKIERMKFANEFKKELIKARTDKIIKFADLSPEKTEKIIENALNSLKDKVYNGAREKALKDAKAAKVDLSLSQLQSIKNEVIRTFPEEEEMLKKIIKAEKFTSSFALFTGLVISTIIAKRVITYMISPTAASWVRDRFFPDQGKSPQPEKPQSGGSKNQSANISTPMFAYKFRSLNERLEETKK